MGLPDLKTLIFEEQANSQPLVSAFGGPVPYEGEKNGDPLAPGAARRYFQLYETDANGNRVQGLTGGSPIAHELNDRMVNDTNDPDPMSSPSNPFNQWNLVTIAAHGCRGRSRLILTIGTDTAGPMNTGTPLSILRVFQFEEILSLDKKGNPTVFFRVEDCNKPLDERETLDDFLKRAIGNAARRPVVMTAYGVAAGVQLSDLKYVGSDFGVILLLPHEVDGFTRITAVCVSASTIAQPTLDSPILG